MNNKKFPQYKQGTYNPINKEKYIGSHKPVYRSSWELKAFITLDKNPQVIKWGSENIIIPYNDQTRGNSIHRYLVDLFFEAIDDQGHKTKYIVEIKPFIQTIPPKPNKRKKPETLLSEQVTFARNSSKWVEASKFAKSKGWKFVIWTEKQLVIQ